MHPLLRGVFEALDELELSWCLLRGQAELGRPDGDVDLLLAPGDLRTARRVLSRLGFARLPAWGHGSHSFFVGYHPSTGEWVKLDVVTELDFGSRYELRSGAGAGCLARRLQGANVAVLTPDDAFWTLLLHCLLDKGMVPRRHATALAELVPGARADGPVGHLVNAACPAGWSADRIIEHARGGHWEQLASLAHSLAAGWRRRGRVRAGLRPIATRTLRIADRLTRPIRRRGLGVALLGPDGAGKSTVTAAIRDRFFLPVHSIYMGLYPGGASRRPRWRPPGVGLVVRLARQWARGLSGQYHQLRGRLVLFDRYSYDSLLPSDRPLSRLDRVRRLLLARTSPRPSLVVILDAPADVLYARKREHNVELLERQRQSFRSLHGRLPHSVVIDAGRDVEAVARDVTAAIWQAYARGWR